MYGCARQEQTLRDFAHQKFGPAATALVQSYADGSFDAVVERCRARRSGSAADLDALCLWLEPASLEVLGRTGEADLALKSTCEALPHAGPRSDARAKLVALLLLSLTDAVKRGKYQPSEERRAALPRQYCALCEVPESQLVEAMRP
jgi:hypothetical protein